LLVEGAKIKNLNHVSLHQVHKKGEEETEPNPFI
jgi:hypothetical protein